MVRIFCPFQAAETRQKQKLSKKQKLESELAKLGLTRRYDSRLCDAFESGGALAHGWSAAGVAKKVRV